MSSTYYGKWIPQPGNRVLNRKTSAVMEVVDVHPPTFEVCVRPMNSMVLGVWMKIADVDPYSEACDEAPAHE